jgi:hypothetical protein
MDLRILIELKWILQYPLSDTTSYDLSSYVRLSSMQIQTHLKPHPHI